MTATGRPPDNLAPGLREKPARGAAEAPAEPEREGPDSPSRSPYRPEIRRAPIPRQTPRRKFHRDFREGAGRLVRETGKPIAQVARDRGIKRGHAGDWVNVERRRRGEADGALSEG